VIHNINIKYNNLDYFPNIDTKKSNYKQVLTEQKSCQAKYSQLNMKACFAPYILKNKVSFDGRIYREDCKSLPGNKLDYICSDTQFFRDPISLMFLTRYLAQNFPDGTHIANFGCSSGEETITISTMLQGINQDRKYTITGYDTSDKMLDIAQKGIYEYDSVKDFKKNLNRHGFNDFSFYFDGDMEAGQEESFQVKNEVFQDILGYKKGNIFEIDKILEQEDEQAKNPGVIVFRNAWYHLTGNLDPQVYSDYNLDTVRETVKKIHKILPENGILVCGNSEREHLFYDNPEFLDPLVTEGGYDFSPFHNVLKEEGFEPVFYSGCQRPYDEVYVPIIWKKISN